MNTDYGHFKNKNVLKTGDTGFKGSWLAYWLHQLGAKVYGFALLPHCIGSRPPHVINVFKAIDNKKAIVTNCATIPRNPMKIERFDPLDKRIGYNRGIRHG